MSGEGAGVRGENDGKPVDSISPSPAPGPSPLPSGAWSQSGGLFVDSRLSRLGVHHGVTTRALGNMKVASARTQAFSEAGVGLESAFFLQQSHGAEIFKADGPIPTDALPQADGWITQRPDRILCVFIADCMPIFMWDEASKSYGLFHAGWRGAAEKLPAKAVAAFESSYGIKPKSLKASIGPHIGPCCYKVSPEMIERFDHQSFVSKGEAVYLDLAAEAKTQMVKAGMDADSIATDSPCTSSQSDLFFSFRRDKQDARMLAFLSPPR